MFEKMKMAYSNLILLVVGLVIGIVGLVGVGLQVTISTLNAVNSSLDATTRTVLYFTPVFIALAVLSLVGGVIYMVSRGGE